VPKTTWRRWCKLIHPYNLGRVPTISVQRPSDLHISYDNFQRNPEIVTKVAIVIASLMVPVMSISKSKVKFRDEWYENCKSTWWDAKHWTPWLWTNVASLSWLVHRWPSNLQLHDIRFHFRSWIRRIFYGRRKISDTFNSALELLREDKNGITFMIQGAPDAGKTALLDVLS